MTTPTSALDMTGAGYRSAVATLKSAEARSRAQAETDRTMARLRAKHPDLVAAADAKARERHNGLVVAQARALHDLNAAKAAPRGDETPLLRERSAERLRAAQSSYDAATLAVEASSAVLPGAA